MKSFTLGIRATWRHSFFFFTSLEPFFLIGFTEYYNAIFILFRFYNISSIEIWQIYINYEKIYVKPAIIGWRIVQIG